MYDYLLGGTTNFEADREAAVKAGEAVGDIEVARASVRGNREFLGRAVRWLVEQGVHQFLDIGTGIPGSDNVHAVAQRAAPEARVVYVDNDPIVLAHAHELLNGTPQGATTYLHGDLRDPDDILARAAATLDPAKPVAVMLVAILHHISDDEDPYGIVARLMRGVASGSYLVISQLAGASLTSRATSTPTRWPPWAARYRPGRATGSRCAATPRSPGSSTTWSWWTLAWSPSTNGTPKTHPGTRDSPTTTAPSDTNPEHRR